MDAHGTCGLYKIECLANGAAYVGQGKNVVARVASHHTSLARGNHDVPLLQADWNNYGPESFSFWIKFVPESSDLATLEGTAIWLMNSLEHLGGYNRALVREWSISARIRNTEHKLQPRRFSLLPDTVEWLRIAQVQVQIFCQKDKPLSVTRSRQAAFDGYNMPPLVINPMHGFHEFQPILG